MFSAIANKDEKPGKEARFVVVLLTRQYEIKFSDKLGRAWLLAYCGRPKERGMMPRNICRWLAKPDSREPGRSLVIRGDGGQLFVKRHRPDPSGLILLLLQVVKTRRSEAVRKHGELTPREGEVQHWLGEGKSNGEIGQILDMRLGTVRKHLERVYAKLGVENRTAAAAFWLLRAA